MKSIRDQQSPQSSPWPSMRVRQATQTGGSSRSASEATRRRNPRLAAPVPGRASGISEVGPASSIAMIDMIGPGPAPQEEGEMRRHA